MSDNISDVISDKVSYYDSGDECEHLYVKTSDIVKINGNYEKILYRCEYCNDTRHKIKRVQERCCNCFDILFS